MALTTTLAAMTIAARQVVGLVGSRFVDDTTEIHPAINRGIRRVWKLLTDGDSDRGLVITTLATTTGTTMYDLPARFMRIRGLDVALGNGRYREILPFALQERNLQARGRPRYRVIGNGVDGEDCQLWIEPDPGTATYRLLYVEAPPPLVADDDEFDGIIGFEEYPILWAAIQMRIKAQEDSSREEARLKEIEAEIIDEAARRDVSGNVKIARVRQTRRAVGPWR